MISSRKTSFADFLAYLPLLALAIDLFTPFLIWQGLLPAAVRWVSHFAIALMILLTILRMLVFNHIPRSFWLIISVSILWFYVALANGQGLPATLWGVWLLFQFPFVGLFMYLQPIRAEQLPNDLRRLGFLVLCLQVAAQLLQYALGATPGDSLSGLFGKNGTGNAVLFAILICCLYFGYWITTQRWRGLIAAIFLSAVSSTLGEMKLFPIAITIIGILAIIFFARKHSVPVKMLVYLIFLFFVVIGFFGLYNLMVPGAAESPLQTYLTSPDTLLAYLFRVETFYSQGNTYTDIGRGAAVEIGWNSIQRDPLTFFLGYGIGTRSESQALGTSGIALNSSSFGPSVGTSLLVMLQEMGLVGMLLLFGLYFWVLATLSRDILKDPYSEALELRFALVLFSALWPLFIWYANVWIMRVPMLLYWLALGFVLAEANMPLMKTFKKKTLSTL
jgi:hypothetical protein